MNRYQPVKLFPGLWTHKYRPIFYTLVVDEFIIKYVGKKHEENIVLESQE